jgi:polysaccharide biosynthesis protein PslH
MRILFITDRIPYPAVSGNLQRTYHLIRRFARDHELWLAAPLNSEEEARGAEHMRDFCHQVVTGTRRRGHPIRHLPGVLRYLWQGKPLEYLFEHCEELFQKIRQLTETTHFDRIHIEPSYMGLYLEAISPKTDARTALTFHNVESSLFEQLARVEQAPVARVRNWLHSRALRRWEASYTDRFDDCITVSEEDRKLLHAINPRLRIKVSPNGVDTHELQPLPAAEGDPALVFVGSMNYAACVDAALFLCRQILPRIQHNEPSVQLWLVGRDPVDEVKRLAGEKVHVTGWVESVEPYYRRSTVSVVPLRAGGGTRLKILESMALGRPVVSTAKGCEGLAVVDGEEIFIADSPEEFAAKTSRLLAERTLRERMAHNARQLVMARYNWDAIARDLLHYYATPIFSGEVAMRTKGHLSIQEKRL